MADTGPQLTTFGTGQGAISAAFLNSLAQTCNIIADLRAFIGVTGAMVWTRGGASIGDGLQGFFYWSASSTAPDDGTNVIEPTGVTTGRWLRSSAAVELQGFSSSPSALIPDGDYMQTVGTSNARLAAVNTESVYFWNGAAPGVYCQLSGGNVVSSYGLLLPTSLGAAGQILGLSVTVPGQLAWLTVGGTAATQQGQIGGLILSNDGVAPNTKIDITAGYATSDDVSTVMSIGAFSKTTTGTFVAGSGNTGLDAGSIAASTWYHVFLIQNTTTVTNDILFSTSIGSPAMPSGYTVKRYIGSFKTDGSSHILAFTQVLNYFIWGASPTDVNTGGLGASPQTFTLGGIPTGISAMADLNCSTENAVANGTTVFSPLTASGASANLWNVAGQFGYANIKVLTNTSAQIKAVASQASTTFALTTVGYYNLTRGSA